ncbi:protein-glutamine gamma-glutamyltransferase E-like isoform X1 [Pleurodeles waltl]|uniref:protein-glutamine gamma-glutamyltransferase E-like isoform X1 n=1 Tax=Pleurodeles waltl TaxID=8319 RepID=UPI003709AB42
MTALRVTGVDFQLSANRTAHNTKDFSNRMLILRRGQGFNITLNLSRALGSQETIGFTVETGPSPSVSKSTKAVFPLSKSASSGTWSAVQGSSSSTSLRVTITSPAIAVIGAYKLGVQISSGGRTSSAPLGDFMLLFNPWVSGDDVYMSNDAERKEYVLNENGVIFWHISGSSRPWDYGQFEIGILEICFKILDQSPDYRENAAEHVSKRNDPKYIGRLLSAMINVNDQDNGVLVGRWSGSYADGVVPTKWNSSTPILRQWADSGPVKYAQCWVFAGVLCTVLRCLGIPSRVITNFQSAHDTNENLLVEEIYNESGQPIDSPDSVWNFHVWNEGWLVRDDLGSSYNGWQIFDATPQEKSEGIFRLGPTSRNAIKEGDVDLPYDGRFLFAEVNGDKVQMVEHEDGSRERIYSDSKGIGQKTSTKAVGSDARVDVTDGYKYAEGTAKEREIFNKARSKLRGVSRGMSRMAAFSVARAEAAPPQKPEFSGKFLVEGTPEVGKDISLTLSLKNDSSDTLKVDVKSSATAITYTRKPVKEVMTATESVTLGPNEEKRIPLIITYAQYEGRLTEHNLILVNAVCNDDKGGKQLVETDITLKNPPVIVKVTRRRWAFGHYLCITPFSCVNGQAKVDQPVQVEVIFTNPLAKDVSKCELVVEGSGLLEKPLKISLKPLKQNQRSRVMFEIVPYKSGAKKLLVDFSSDKFNDVKGSQNITVAEA